MRPRLAALALAAVAAGTGAAAQDLDGYRVGLCGDHRIEGTLPEPLEGPGFCGVPAPVRIERIGAVEIRPPVTVNCRTARALAAWVERGPARVAPRLLDGSLEAIATSGSYACRTRNFLGGRLSEHAAGNAVDLVGFVLRDGRTVSIVRDWRDGGARGDFLLAAWRAACGPFGTVLGPDHDARHGNHFHLDTAARTDGPRCR